MGSDVLFGGSPPRLLRLNAAGVRALEELRGGPVGSPDSGRLARRLTDTGLAHPRPPAPPRPAEVTVVIPVRDRPAGLDRCLSALGPGYPVIVVDDGSADPAATAGVCQRHGARLRAAAGARRARPGPERRAGPGGHAARRVPRQRLRGRPGLDRGDRRAFRRPDGRRGGAAGPAA